MKKLLVLIGLFSLCSCSDQEKNLQETDRVVLSNYDLLDFSQNKADHELISEYSRKLFLADFSESEYNEINKNLKELYGSGLMPYSELKEQIKFVKLNANNSETNIEDLQYYSPEGIRVLNKIREVLETAVDEPSFLLAVHESEKIIETSTIKDENEKNTNFI